jgi:hypothetical protein
MRGDYNGGCDEEKPAAIVTFLLFFQRKIDNQIKSVTVRHSTNQPQLSQETGYVYMFILMSVRSLMNSCLALQLATLQTR